jgi:hypothetical protein
MRGKGEKRDGRQPMPFMVAPRGGGGVRGRCHMEGGNREERGGPGRGGDSSSSWHRPPAGGRGGAVVAQQGRAADRQDRATMGPGGQRLGVGGVGGSRVVRQGR